MHEPKFFIFVRKFNFHTLPPTTITSCWLSRINELRASAQVYDFYSEYTRRVRLLSLLFSYFFFTSTCSFHTVISVTSSFPSSPIKRTLPAMFIRSATRLPHIPRFARLHRTFATQINMPVPAALHLKTGQTFKGRAFGAPQSIWGETVFSTSITSCESACTD